MSKRPIRNLRFSILIVCEGEKTEPLYFDSIRDEINGFKIWSTGVKIKISPEPSIDKKVTETIEKHKTKRKKRNLKETKEEEIVRKKIENKFKAIPVRFVREAQKELEDGTYDEVWAVFDHDNQRKRKEAFELASKLVDGKNVNIAFSSRSFEHWLLLHFEQNQKAFHETECKDVNGRPIGCNKTKGCLGKECLWGKLRHNTVLLNCKKNSNVFSLLKPKLHTAYVNAIWLRKYSEKAEGNKAIYDRNPYTDVDRLVRRLYIPADKIEWINFNEDKIIENVIFRFKIQKGIIQVDISNKSNSMFLLRDSDFIFIDTSGNEQQIELHHNLNVGQQKTIPLSIPNPNNLDGSILLFQKNSYSLALEIDLS